MNQRTGKKDHIHNHILFRFWPEAAFIVFPDLISFRGQVFFFALRKKNDHHSSTRSD